MTANRLSDICPKEEVRFIFMLFKMYTLFVPDIEKSLIFVFLGLNSNTVTVIVANKND